MNERVTRVRLLNIDAPESVDPNSAVECLGPEASTKLKALLPAGTEIELRYDRERIDRYGRTLAAVFSHNRLINAEMVRSGLAVPMTVGSNVTYRPDMDTAFAVAAAREVGLFAPTIECTMPGRAEALHQSLVLLAEPTTLETPEEAEDVAAQAVALIAAAEDLKGTVEAQAMFVSRALSFAGRSAVLDSLNVLQSSANDIQGAARRRAAEIRRERAVAARAQAQAHARAVAKARAQAATKAKAAAKAKAKAESAAGAASFPRMRQPQSQPRQHTAVQHGSSGSSHTTRSNPSGYTGCRRYAPGGKTWVPIPCP